MRKYLVVAALLAALATPASAQLNSQQQRMKDCNAQASGVSGEARQQFMSSCLVQRFRNINRLRLSFYFERDPV